MKMLGADVVTQEEFDEFMRNEYTSLVTEVGALQNERDNLLKKVNINRKYVIAALLVSLLALGVQLVQYF